MDHPNIVTVHEAGESDYGLFIAMELIRGATLKDLIVGRELDAGRTLSILTQVADALDSAHEAGLIHRDIKPHNILVRAGRRDHAFLADFGVTKVRGGTNLTKTGHFVGTVDYMAPEQIRGEPATARDRYLRARNRPLRVPVRGRAVPEGLGRRRHVRAPGRPAAHDHQRAARASAAAGRRHLDGDVEEPGRPVLVGRRA